MLGQILGQTFGWPGCWPDVGTKYTVYSSTGTEGITIDTVHSSTGVEKTEEIPFIPCINNPIYYKNSTVD